MMDQNTILQLAQLNTQFYQTIASDFSSSRQYNWIGWEKIVSLLEARFSLTWKEKNNLSVLDVACGNGRFARFLDERLSQPIQYVGIDNSEALLQEALEKQVTLKKTNSFQFQQKDLITTLLKGELAFSQPFMFISVFGFLHHIPSFALRQSLLNSLAAALEDHGLLLVTAWQFLERSSLQTRVVPPEVLGFKPEQLEKNDYFLDWRKGHHAYRYCHLVDKEEIEKLLVGSSLTLVDSFRSDGKENNLNTYYLLEKSPR